MIIAVVFKHQTNETDGWMKQSEDLQIREHNQALKPQNTIHRISVMHDSYSMKMQKLHIRKTTKLLLKESEHRECTRTEHF